MIVWGGFSQLLANVSALLWGEAKHIIVCCALVLCFESMRPGRDEGSLIRIAIEIASCKPRCFYVRHKLRNF